MKNYGWVKIPKRYMDDKLFWEELDGVFYPRNDKKDTLKSEYTVGGDVYILGMSDWFDDCSMEIDSIWDSPVYEVCLDYENNEFMGFERTIVNA